MKPLRSTGILAGLTLAWFASPAAETAPQIYDPRNIVNGFNIPGEGYVDQPYIVKADDGAWVCLMTTGKGSEGAPGEHVISMRSMDLGKTWTNIVPLEPSDGPEAAYGVLLKVPFGRIYAFYNHNTDRVAEAKRDDGGVYKRVDCLGHYVFKYSDDNGLTWSSRRYDVPIRAFAYDTNNINHGTLRYFWNVGRPLLLKDSALMVIIKVGGLGEGFYSKSEGAFFKSHNILTERDPTKLSFETLPDGDKGLRTPPGGGPISEEESVVSLSDGSLFCVYRTIDGWASSSYSRDGGHVWSTPQYMAYTPGGKRMKHPRAANFAWNCSNGKFLYWYHNHGGIFIQKMGEQFSGGASPYDDRNPVWVAAGREVDSPEGKKIEWSQPEILLYDDDPFIRMSYPDLVEQGGKYYVTETQKNLARVHEISSVLLNGLFHQWDNRTVAQEGLILNLAGSVPSTAKMPVLPMFLVRDMKKADFRAKDLRGGCSIDLWLKPGALTAGQSLLDNRTASGQGFKVMATSQGALEIIMNDGREDSAWSSDAGLFSPDRPHHVVITLDGGPKIITFVVDGVLCDGGDQRQFGWGHYDPWLRSLNGSPELKIADNVRSLRIYGRPLRTSEAVANFHAGMAGAGAL